MLNNKIERKKLNFFKKMHKKKKIKNKIKKSLPSLFILMNNKR
jgi:hypothetical protein